MGACQKGRERGEGGKRKRQGDKDRETERKKNERDRKNSRVGIWQLGNGRTIRNARLPKHQGMWCNWDIQKEKQLCGEETDLLSNVNGIEQERRIQHAIDLVDKK